MTILPLKKINFTTTKCYKIKKQQNNDCFSNKKKNDYCRSFLLFHFNLSCK